MRLWGVAIENIKNIERWLRDREGVGSENVARLQARASESEGRLILDHREIHFRPAADAF